MHTNFMLNMNLGGTDYFYEYVKGIKTGTSDTYRNLATSAVKDGYNYICVVMGAPIYDSYGKKYPIYTYLDTKNPVSYTHLDVYKRQPICQLRV